MSSNHIETCPPSNFSWIVKNKLAAMACPKTPSNLEYLVQEGIKHLVTLSPEKNPPITGFKKMKWTTIGIEEFEPPNISQIIEFINICEESLRNEEVSEAK